MCGIAGFFSPNIPGNRVDRIAMLGRMVDSLVHRGPDARGSWVSNDASLGLGMRRLAVIDLSPAGEQPMESRDGRFRIVFNGEIYNAEELARQLEGSRRGHSDTEVLIELIAALGLEETLRQVRGMFAFALWDEKDRSLFLCRDRVGEKPLYYGTFSGCHFFASELRAFTYIPQWDGSISKMALEYFLRLAYVPAPLSIYENAWKLPPGCYARINDDGEIKISRYWCAREVALHGRRNPFAGSLEDAASELSRILGAAVREQMVSDVPLGAFLSGGIDSSSIVALMQANGSAVARTFTIGFWTKTHDESPDARAVGAHLGTLHTELILGAHEAAAVIPDLGRVFDEPFADSSQIPTLLVSRLARQSVTVALSGDGGDEIFGGYNRHILARSWWPRLRLLPPALRRSMSGAISRTSIDALNRFIAFSERLLPPAHRYRELSGLLRKLGRVIRCENLAEVYDALIRFGLTSHRALSRDALATPLPLPLWRGLNESPWSLGLDEASAFMLLDTESYLPDDILVKVDRAAMSCSLETRVPFLDLRVMEFAASLPISFKIDGRQGKVILSKMLEQYIPRHLFERPKAGFGIPIGAWLRSDLREWADSVINASTGVVSDLRQEWDIPALWAEHTSGRADHAHALWTVIMLGEWEKAHRGAV